MSPRSSGPGTACISNAPERTPVVALMPEPTTVHDAWDMHVLVVYAHHSPTSFCRALLEQVELGLTEGGHTHEVIDLHAEGFDPVFRDVDQAAFIHRTTPPELLDRDVLEAALVGSARDPVRRFLRRRWARGRSRDELVAVFEAHRPADVRAHQERVARADGLIFVAPVFWMGFPAILKGWFERVFAYGFAYTLEPKGWRGDLEGRVPLFTQAKALVLTPTFFSEAEYDTGWRDAMDTVVCDWGLKMAGVREAEHVYFYAVLAADDATRAGYLERARTRAREF